MRNRLNRRAAAIVGSGIGLTHAARGVRSRCHRWRAGGSGGARWCRRAMRRSTARSYEEFGDLSGESVNWYTPVRAPDDADYIDWVRLLRGLHRRHRGLRGLRRVRGPAPGPHPVRPGTGRRDDPAAGSAAVDRHRQPRYRRTGPRGGSGAVRRVLQRGLGAVRHGRRHAVRPAPTAPTRSRSSGTPRPPSTRPATRSPRRGTRWSPCPTRSSPTTPAATPSSPGAPASAPVTPPAGSPPTGWRTSCSACTAPTSTTSGSTTRSPSTTPRSPRSSRRSAGSSRTPTTSTAASAACSSIATTEFLDGGLPILDGNCFMHRQAGVLLHRRSRTGTERGRGRRHLGLLPAPDERGVRQAAARWWRVQRRVQRPTR